MKQDEIKEILRERELSETLLFEDPSYDTAFIGLTDDDRAIYSYDKMIEYLQEEDGMPVDEAMDFISYNTVRALPYAGPMAPIICYDLC